MTVSDSGAPHGRSCGRRGVCAVQPGRWRGQAAGQAAACLPRQAKPRDRSTAADISVIPSAQWLTVTGVAPGPAGIRQPNPTPLVTGSVAKVCWNSCYSDDYGKLSGRISGGAGRSRVGTVAIGCHPVDRAAQPDTIGPLREPCTRYADQPGCQINSVRLDDHSAVRAPRGDGLHQQPVGAAYVQEGPVAGDRLRDVPPGLPPGQLIAAESRALLRRIPPQVSTPPAARPPSGSPGPSAPAMSTHRPSGRNGTKVIRRTAARVSARLGCSTGALESVGLPVAGGLAITTRTVIRSVVRNCPVIANCCRG
jgi:hypothetical protein